MPEGEEGQRNRTKIIEVVDDHPKKYANHPKMFKFSCIVNDDETREEIVSYNQIVDLIEQDDGLDEF
jgi:hypothetical protein